MSTNREMIDSLRNKLREQNADSNYSNKFLYQTLLEQTNWIIRREATGGRIWNSTTLFQNYSVRMIEVPLIDSCLPISSNCKIYRSAEKLPDLWEDANGPIIKSVTSVDGSTEFFVTTASVWGSKRKDPYKSKLSKQYAFFEDGYLWSPEKNPHFLTVLGYYMSDIALTTQNCLDCDEKDCVRFLDTSFKGPNWVEAEVMAKAVELLAGVSKRLPEDEEINKNPTRKT